MKRLIIIFLILCVNCFSQTENLKGTIVVHSTCEKFLGNDTLFSKVDKTASFPNGEKSLLKFIQKQCIYPRSEYEQGIEGMSVVQYIVQKNGLITDIQLFETSNNILFDAEAVRVVKLMPKWIPGTCNGEKVAVVYYLPIKFRLK